MHSNEYKDLKTEYSDVLKNIREANAELLKKRPKPAAPAATPNATPNAKPPATTPPAAKPLPPTDSSVPPGYTRDPQTGVIRKKREGE